MSHKTEIDGLREDIARLRAQLNGRLADCELSYEAAEQRVDALAQALRAVAVALDDGPRQGVFCNLEPLVLAALPPTPPPSETRPPAPPLPQGSIPDAPVMRESGLKRLWEESQEPWLDGV